MNKEATPQIEETNDAFVEIINREYGIDASKKLGETAIGQVEPFGHQFMDDIISIGMRPTATSPGGRTSTIQNGQACFDDPDSSDVS